MIAESNNQIIWLASDIPDERTPSVVEKVRSFSVYDAGWCYGDGEPFSQAVIERSVAVVEMFGMFGWNTEAFPGPEGEIAISATNGHSLRVTIKADGPLGVEWKLNRKTVMERELLEIELYNLLSQNSQWNTFGSYIQAGGAPQRTSGTTSPSNRQAKPEGVVFLWSIRDVQATNPEVSAGIYRNIALHSGRHTYFGDSTQTILQTIP